MPKYQNHCSIMTVTQRPTLAFNYTYQACYRVTDTVPKLAPWNLMASYLGEPVAPTLFFFRKRAVGFNIIKSELPVRRSAIVGGSIFILPLICISLTLDVARQSSMEMFEFSIFLRNWWCYISYTADDRLISCEVARSISELQTFNSQKIYSLSLTLSLTRS